MEEEQRPQEVKGARDRASIRKAVETELREARIKEMRGKLKKLAEEVSAARAVVKGKEEQIQDLFEEYSDVLPE
jgi:hypothetical protein